MTPTERAQAELKRFLSTEDAETLCFSGHWGVGKTYTWQTLLTEATNANEVGLRRYAYVSLFGINSLDDLKLTIFEIGLRVSWVIYFITLVSYAISTTFL